MGILHFLQYRKQSKAKGQQHPYTWWISPKGKCSVKWATDPAEVTQRCFVWTLSCKSCFVPYGLQIFCQLLGKCKTSDYDRNKPSVESCRVSQNLAEAQWTWNLKSLRQQTPEPRLKCLLVLIFIKIGGMQDKGQTSIWKPPGVFFHFVFLFCLRWRKLDNFKLLKLEKEHFHSVVEIELCLG